MKRLLKWVIGLGVIAALGWWWFKPSEAETNGPDLEPEIVDIQNGDLKVVVEATGQVIPNAAVEVKSKASGELLELPFEEGDFVTSGELLVELDPDDERRNVLREESNLLSTRARLVQAQSQLQLMESDSERILAQAEANLNQAMARYQDAEARYQRRVELSQQGVLSDEELEAAQTTFEEARSQLQNAQADFDDAQVYPMNVELRRQDIILAEAAVRDQEIALEEAQERFDDTRILAPATGVITDLQVEEGQIIASGVTNVGGGTTLMIISDLSRLFIEVKVDETDIGKVNVGHACEIIVDAFPELVLPGTVEWIAPQGLEENNIVSFDVKVEINLDQASPEIIAGLTDAVVEELDPVSRDLSALGLRPNMTARVEIITADLHEVVLIPNEAIQRGEVGRRYVQVLSDEASGEQVSARPAARSQRPRPASRPSPGQRRPASRPGGGGRSWQNGNGQGEETDLASLFDFEEPPTIERDITLGPSDGIQTHVVNGLSSGEQVLIPIPEWRLEFLRSQMSGDEGDNRRRRRMRF